MFSPVFCEISLNHTHDSQSRAFLSVHEDYISAVSQVTSCTSWFWQVPADSTIISLYLQFDASVEKQ